MNTLEKAEFTVSIFLELGIPIYNAEVPDMAGRKTETTALFYYRIGLNHP